MAYPEGLKRAIEAVARLRGENGCPWDKAQTHASLRTYLLEETHEALEAIDQLQTAGPAPLKEELGDVLFQVLFHAQIAAENNDFTLDEVADGLAEKLVRRHPHVFGDAKVSSAEEVAKNWEKAKRAEKPRESALEGIPPTLPALQRSLKVIEKVSKVGFQWENLAGPLGKVREELAEFLGEVEKLADGVATTRETTVEPELKKKLESELGDLLFTLANVAYFLRLNPEDALRSMLGRFEQRFRHVEKRARESGRALPEMSLAEMDVFWEEAKKISRS